jgi:hypothetical protein
MPRVRAAVVVVRWSCGIRCTMRRRACVVANNMIVMINTALANLLDVVVRRETVIAGCAPSIAAEPMPSGLDLCGLGSAKDSNFRKAERKAGKKAD